jgi:hypothetical protein
LDKGKIGVVSVVSRADREGTTLPIGVRTDSQEISQGCETFRFSDWNLGDLRSVRRIRSSLEGAHRIGMEEQEGAAQWE